MSQMSIYKAGRFPPLSPSCPFPFAIILSCSSSSRSKSANVFPDALCPVTGVFVPLLFAEASCELSPCDGAPFGRAEGPGISRQSLLSASDGRKEAKKSRKKLRQGALRGQQRIR